MHSLPIRLFSPDAIAAARALKVLVNGILAAAADADAAYVAVQGTIFVVLPVTILVRFTQLFADAAASQT